MDDIDIVLRAIYNRPFRCASNYLMGLGFFYAGARLVHNHDSAVVIGLTLTTLLMPLIIASQARVALAEQEQVNVQHNVRP